MEKKICYATPVSRVIVVAQKSIICLSGNSGTEKVDVRSTGYDDSDFE